MYCNIFLKKSFLLYKIYVNIKISLSKNLVRVVVIVDKANYLDKMENLLNDTRKFEKINLKNDGILNLPVNQEKRVDKLAVSNSISEETRRSLKPVETRPGTIYGHVTFTKISSIIARLFDLFCLQLILLPINYQSFLYLFQNL